MVESKFRSLKWYSRYPFLISLMFMLLGFSISAHAQKIMVKGVITGYDDGQPIPGVSVVIKGTTVGTITDINGKYSIKATKGNTLVIRFVGMQSQELIVGKSATNVKLKSNVIGLDEVVAIGYGAVKKKEVTGAVAQVKAEQIDKMVTADLGNALQGQVAGVSVTASGEPGAGSSILIRGVSSISGNNQPLYVVDGIEMEGDPRLSPNEIETIDILKDAASCAIYGTRGAAGVILITTKQGKAGSLKISLNASYGIQNIRSNTSLMGASDQIYADLMRMNNIYDVALDNTMLEVLRNPYFYQNNTNLNDAVYINNAGVQNYDLNMSGGTKDITYNATMGYYDQKGVVISSGFKRFNARINTTYTHNKWKINAGVGLTMENRTRPPGGIITNALKYHPTNQDISSIGGGPIYTDSPNEAQNTSWVLNSFNDTDKSDNTTCYANLNVNYKVTNKLSVNARIATRGYNSYRHRFSPFQEIYNPDGSLATDRIRDSRATMDAAKNRSLNFNYGVTYRTSFNKKHNLTLYAGQSVERYTYDAFEAQKSGVSNNNINVLNGAIANPAATSGNNYTNKLVGIIGRVQYNYKSKYLFSGSLRRDASSKFAKKNEWGTFPSASVAWNVMDEGFWKPLRKTINQMKFRVSYGEVGNQNFQPYSYSAGIVNGLDYIFNGAQAFGSAQTSYANADVKWETSKQTNIGLDMAFLGNKLTFSAEYYNTNKKDMLMPIQVPSSNGSLATTSMHTYKNSNVILNVGDMTNKGCELALGYKIKTGKINWNFSGTFSTNKNKITKINGLGGFTMTSDQGLIPSMKSQSQVTALAEGHEAGAFFLRPTNGIIKTQAQLAAYQKIDGNAKMGDLIYVDTNNDGVISDDDRTYAGSGLPNYEVGFNINADYKGFDLSIQTYAAGGHEIMNGAKATAFAFNRHKSLTNQWTPVNPTSNIPSYRGLPRDHANYAGYTSLWLEDGSFFRVRNITLGYTLPKRVTQKVNISKCRFFVTAQNPFTFTKYSGFDPEVAGSGINSRGLDKGNYPITSLYSLGVNLNF